MNSEELFTQSESTMQGILGSLGRSLDSVRVGMSDTMSRSFVQILRKRFRQSITDIAEASNWATDCAQEDGTFSGADADALKRQLETLQLKYVRSVDDMCDRLLEAIPKSTDGAARPEPGAPG